MGQLTYRQRLQRTAEGRAKLEAQKARERERQKKKRENETSPDRRARLDTKRQKRNERLAKETDEQRLARLDRERLQKTARRALKKTEQQQAHSPVQVANNNDPPNIELLQDVSTNKIVCPCFDSNEHTGVCQSSVSLAVSILPPPVEIDENGQPILRCLSCNFEMNVGPMAKDHLDPRYRHDNTFSNEYCTACYAANDQVRQAVHSNDHVRYRMQQLPTLTQYNPVEWPEEVHSISLKESEVFDLLRGIQGLSRTQSYIAWEDNSTITYKRLDLECGDYSDEQRDQVKGGSFPLPQDCVVPESAKLSNPGPHVTFGIVNIPSVDPTKKLSSGRRKGKKRAVETNSNAIDDGCNFVLVGSSKIDNQTIMEWSAEESQLIKLAKKGSRDGAACGWLFPSNDTTFDPPSLSKCTKNARVFQSKENSHCTGVKMWYPRVHKKKGKRLASRTIYKNMYMGRWTKKQKRDALLQGRVYQRVIIAEMESRLQALAFLDLMGMVPLAKRADWLKRLYSAADKIQRRCVQDEWLKYNPNLDLWQMLLLEYASSTGEMRNHEDCKAHVDKNRSHFLETMTLFGRCHPAKDTTAKECVDNMQDGMLSLLFSNVVLKIRCGHDILHMNLDKTMHIADTTRRWLNWSKVHGP